MTETVIETTTGTVVPRGVSTNKEISNGDWELVGFHLAEDGGIVGEDSVGQERGVAIAVLSFTDDRYIG